MTRLDRLLLAILIVAALSFVGIAMAQDGAHTHPDIDAKNAEQDAAISETADDLKQLDSNVSEVKQRVEANAAALAERAEIDAVIGAEIIDIKARLGALEAGAPEPEPEPEPEPVTPLLYLVNADGSKGARVGAAVTVQGKFNLCTESGPGPVTFSISEQQFHSERDPAYCMMGGNAAPFPAAEWAAGNYPVTIKAAGFSPVTIDLTVAPPTGPPDPEPGERSKLQTSDWYAAPFNAMEVYANILHASETDWNGGGMRTKALIEAGHIDRKTGLPVSLPNGQTLTSGVYFTGQGYSEIWDGEWILEADCTGDVVLDILYAPSQRVKKVSGCRIEFNRDMSAEQNPTLYHHAIQIKKLNGTLKNLRMYRTENAERIAAGEVTSKRFAENMRGYDVLRMMDGQNANKTVIRSIDDVPSLAAAHWGNVEWQAPETFAKPFQGMPLAAPFMAAVETDTELWHHAPITLGAPKPFMDFRPEDGAIDKWANAYRAMAKANAKEIIESPEWDRYADALVKAMIEAGYPADRPLYTTIANEVWNFSGQYYMTTTYAWGIGDGLALNNQEPLRVGYGALMARWKLALDGALKRAGRDQSVIYVIEGQAFYPARTGMALSGAKAWLESKGEAWEKHAPGFGVSVASYWSATWEAFASAEEWPRLIEADPDGTAKRFADFILNDPAQFGLKSVLDMLRQNRTEGAQFGVAMIGAYEGGSHLERPAYVPKEWYADFHWGEEGARVNYEVNRAIAEAFPGFILSNYVLAGPTGGQPWFDCMYGEPTPLCESWETFKRGDE